MGGFGRRYDLSFFVLVAVLAFLRRIVSIWLYIIVFSGR